MGFSVTTVMLLREIGLVLPNKYIYMQPSGLHTHRVNTEREGRKIDGRIRLCWPALGDMRLIASCVT